MATRIPRVEGGLVPTWEVALLFPAQGAWSEEEYFALSDSANRLIEFDDGMIEVLEMPTEDHQLIVAFLYDALKAFVNSQQLGVVLFAPLRIRTLPGRYREPDVVLMLKQNRLRRGKKYWRGADLVIEVVSDDSKSRDRDLDEKCSEYGEAGISEYWIADPKNRQVIVHRLHEGKYSDPVTFAIGETAASLLLEGFNVDVTSVFAAAEDQV